MGDVMGVIARDYKCVTFENDRAQFNATAVLVPRLELVDDSALVTPLHDVHSKLSSVEKDFSELPTADVCCRCTANIPNSDLCGRCVVCKEKFICEKCFSGFTAGDPKCHECPAAEELKESDFASEEEPAAAPNPSESGS
jgi:hypothetical protein